MSRKNNFKVFWRFSILMLVVLSLNSIAAQRNASLISSSAYPALATSGFPASPTSVSPTSITLPDSNSSDAAQNALEYIAKRDGIPSESLIIQDDHLTEYPFLGRKFQAVTLIDSRSQGQIYKLLIDLADNKIEENISSLLEAEAQASQAQSGKLDPALSQRLQMLDKGETLTVAVWMASPAQKTLADLQASALTVLATKYPEAQAAIERSGKPMEVDDPELAQRIEMDYIALISDEMKHRTLPLVTELEQQGFEVTPYEGMPAFTVMLPKEIILGLRQRADVGALSLAGFRETRHWTPLCQIHSHRLSGLEASMAAGLQLLFWKMEMWIGITRT